jgi:hypothetical protein
MLPKIIPIFMFEPLSPSNLALRVPRGYGAEPAMDVQADRRCRPIRRLHGCLLPE